VKLQITSNSRARELIGKKGNQKSMKFHSPEILLKNNSEQYKKKNQKHSIQKASNL